ncbi:HK97 gp10 family phage protein [Paenibacillus sp. JNUCC31]|uniref:HK97 gp10 family phage protein n=1 Tax=Paenibacillus sp. JNUCC-31 TaxID=2777983 RepID=UPI00177B24C4|nr:HK97 gp10 family phage protein [Paenibacillus sp. JNUCC-31]QOS77948.1 HK97 gp10 family phage protein [Paenibacillus sp. JNUCC-31]QOS77991.1 HK97 gp10 family phage protein [Paenibacillus sp. JNUCC-31]
MTTINQLAQEIVRAVKAYTDDVSDAIETRVDEVAELVRADVEANAPKRTGKYAKGFKVTKQGSSGKAKRVVWNKKKSRIVHLNEFGYAKRGGGRVAGRPHLRPAYDRHAANLPDDIKRIIRNGG